MTHASSGMQTPITCAGVLTRLRKKQLSSSRTHSRYEEQDSGFCTPGSGFLSFTSPECTPLGRERWGGRGGEVERSEGEKVDFLAKLGSEKNYTPALSKIFSLLKDEDLSSISRVSKQWYQVLNSDTIARNRLNSYLNRKISNAENEIESDITKARSAHKAPPTTDNKTVRILTNITNVHSPSSSNTISQLRSNQTERSTKFNLFSQEGQKLSDGEYLSQCPRCELPAKLSKNSPFARCVNKGCEYLYCNSCLCPYSFEPVHSCMLVPPTTPRSRKKFYTVGSKTNLKSLKRCLR